jgi:hypothetical protein
MGGGGKGESKSSKDLSELAQQFAAETGPTRRTLIDQMYEALTTGGVGARIPLVDRAVESSQRATSESLRALDTQLAQTGLAGTPFGERIRAGTEQQGRLATSQVSPNIIGQMIQQIPGFVTGQQQIAVQGLSGAVSGEAQQAGAQASLLAAMMSPFRFSFGPYK